MKKFFLILLFWVAGITLVEAATVTIKFVGPGASVPYHGVDAGYYEVKIDGTTGTVMCDDFSTVIHAGDTWTANVFTYADVMGGAATKFSGAVKYAQAGWLYSQTALASPSDRAQIQGAIWNIMIPGSVVMDSLAQWYYNQAASGSYDNFNWSNTMLVLSPNPHTAGQEFLTPVPVPLPASALLLGSGLLGIMGFIRNKKHKPK